MRGGRGLVGEWRVGLWTLVMRAKRRDLFLLVMFLSDGAGVGLGVRLALVQGDGAFRRKGGGWVCFGPRKR